MSRVRLPNRLLIVASILITCLTACAGNGDRLAEQQPLQDRADLENANLSQNRAVELQYKAKFDEAEALYLESLDTYIRISGEHSVEAARAQTNLASLYVSESRHAEAEELLRKSLATQQEILGDDAVETAWSMTNLGGLLTTLGQLTEAEPLLDNSVLIHKTYLDAVSYTHLTLPTKA